MKPTLHPIGHIETPYSTLEACPRNIDPRGPACRLIVDERYRPGLQGLEPGQAILILYWLGEARPGELILPSRRTGKRAGVFALRTPHRPNPIGAAEVTIEALTEGALTVRGLDCLDGTPLLDIKPAIQGEHTR